jgi:hypothetical protein
MEANRYPEDFNGIIAGAAAGTPNTTLGGGWSIQLRANLTVVGQFPQSKLNLITQFVLAKCDANDRVVD